MNSIRLALVFFAWISSFSTIAHTDTLRQRDNIWGDDVIPIIHLPGISQADFKDAFKVLDECMIVEEPRYGFSHPFIAPGGHYGGCWWQLDASISLQATKWVNQSFSENALRGFISVQKEDGRIPLYGHDKVPDYPECSSLPKLFEAAHAILKQSNDQQLMQEVYASVKKYLDWWLSPVRKDAATGLVTGVFEESFPPVEKIEKATAQVDLNVEIVVGCNIIAALAEQLHKKEDVAKYSSEAKALTRAINSYLWNDKAAAFHSYFVNEKRHDKLLACYTFDPLRAQIATPDKHQKMLKMLQDDAYFNWHHNGVTSVAKTDSTYNETTGAYNGAPAWSGDIWSLRNRAIVQGLEAIGRYDLAAELSLKTVRLFNANYTEFLKPSDGSGHGVKRYAWSAAQYIQLIVENIFGIEYNNFTKTIRIQPNLHHTLAGKEIAIKSLRLPDDSRLSVHVLQEKNQLSIRYILSGKKSDMNIVVAAISQDANDCKVTTAKGKQLKTKSIKKGSATVFEVKQTAKDGAVKFTWH